MSQAIGHFAFGVGATTGVLLATRLNKKIKNTEPIRWVSGLWAAIPDSQMLIPSLKFLHEGWWTDVFWFHQLIDKIDLRDTPLASAIFLAFMVAMLVMFWMVKRREYR